MTPGFVFKLRPNGPWRIGPNDGDRQRAELVYHSDALYSAITGAMRDFGLLDAWLDATARAGDGSAVRFSSCFPWIGKTRLAPPPKHIWPAMFSTKLRWKGARYIPLALVADLLAGKAPEDSRWMVDGPSGCLLPAGSPAGPFRMAVRSSASVDRFLGGVAVHSAACVEFAPNAGLWGAVSFADREAAEKWSGPVKGVIRLLCDSGFGGGRSRGWGKSDSPEFRDGFLPGLILRPAETAATAERATATELSGAAESAAAIEPMGAVESGTAAQPEPAGEPAVAIEPAATEPMGAVESGTAAEPAMAPALAGAPESATATEPSDAVDFGTVAESVAAVEFAPETRAGNARGETVHWLLSLFTPGAADGVDWRQGSYSLVTRAGRVESSVRSGDEKKRLNMVEEGSVLVAPGRLLGAAVDVAPDGFPHPVYRFGCALSIPVPRRVTP